jgi:hypothetical protein
VEQFGLAGLRMAAELAFGRLDLCSELRCSLALEFDFLLVLPLDDLVSFGISGLVDPRERSARGGQCLFQNGDWLRAGESFA